MEWLIRGGADFQRHFNCSFYNVSKVPWGQRTNVPLGVGEIALTGTELLLYVPCLWSIWRRRGHTFNKYMFVMGIFDVLDLAISGPATGWMTARGTVFCEHPTALYILACVHAGAIIGQHLMDLLLALNRCAYFILPDLALKIFPENERWTWAWALIPSTLALLYAMFGSPAFFSGLTGNWMWNPHFGYANKMHEMYASRMSLLVFTVENWVMLVALPLIYGAFFVAVMKRKKGRLDVAITPIFKQVAVITVMQSGTAFLNIYLKHTSVASPLLFKLHLFLNTQTCGIAPVIYLMYSKKIQKDMKRLVKHWFLKFVPVGAKKH